MNLGQSKTSPRGVEVKEVDEASEFCDRFADCRVEELAECEGGSSSQLLVEGGEGELRNFRRTSVMMLSIRWGGSPHSAFTAGHFVLFGCLNSRSAVDYILAEYGLS